MNEVGHGFVVIPPLRSSLIYLRHYLDYTYQELMGQLQVLFDTDFVYNADQCSTKATSYGFDSISQC